MRVCCDNHAGRSGLGREVRLDDSPGGSPERPGFGRVCYDGNLTGDVSPSPEAVLLCCPPDEISKLAYHKLAALRLLGLIFAFDIQIYVADQIAPRSTAFSLMAFVHTPGLSRIKLIKSHTGGTSTHCPASAGSYNDPVACQDIATHRSPGELLRAGVSVRRTDFRSRGKHGWPAFWHAHVEDMDVMCAVQCQFRRVEDMGGRFSAMYTFIYEASCLSL